MRYFIFILLIGFISCNGAKKENIDFILTDKIVLISKDKFNADTVIFNKAGTLNYIHTGIGVKFSGVYKNTDGKISVSILDYERQHKRGSNKEVAVKFDIIKQNNRLFIKNIKKENQLFDKVAIYSNVSFVNH